MFPTIKIFLIYFIIPSSIGDETTKTLSSGEVVEKELAPIKDSFKKVVDSLTDNDLKFEVGVVQGLVKKIIERAVKAEYKVEHLHEEKGCFKIQKESIIQSALKPFAVPYLCRNFVLYESAWDNGGTNSENFNPDDTENTDVKCHDLDTQSFSNYKIHAKIWDRILTSSVHPLVNDFKRRIQLLYPQLNLQIIAKNIGLAYALLNNAKYGVINDEPEIAKLINPDSLILALKGMGALKDPVVLGIIKTFEQVISGL